MATVPILSPEIIHLWRLSPLDATNFTPLKFNICSAEEHAHANTFKQSYKRVQFLHIRSWLRHIMGNYLKVAPQQVQISYGNYGKPFITWPQPAPHFNLSHSDSICLLAVYWNAAIGIDIELIQPRIGIKNIAQRCFNSNIITELNILSENEMLHQFYYHWTCFEAKLKAQGGSVFGVESNDTNRIESINFIPAPGFQGCVAVLGKIPNRNYWQMLELVISHY